jgi:hypothetical protein
MQLSEPLVLKTFMANEMMVVHVDQKQEIEAGKISYQRANVFTSFIRGSTCSGLSFYWPKASLDSYHCKRKGVLG